MPRKAKSKFLTDEGIPDSGLTAAFDPLDKVLLEELVTHRLLLLGDLRKAEVTEGSTTETLADVSKKVSPRLKYTFLHLAIMYLLPIGCVEDLLKLGLDVNATSMNGTPLYLAVSHNNLPAVKLLIEYGVDVKGYGDALIKASMYGRLDIVEYLLKKGTDINARDRSSGSTALHSASLSGHLDVVKYLLEKGADINAIDDEGKTPLGLIEYLIERKDDGTYDFRGVDGIDYVATTAAYLKYLARRDVSPP